MSTHNTPTEPEKRLSAKQLAAVPLLANGSTIASTADHVGVNEKTIDDWKKLPHFMDAVHQAEDEIYNDSLNHLKKTARRAIDCLIRNMEGKVSPYVQVQAAGKLLDLGLDVHKLAEVQADLAELRRMLNDANQR